MIREYILQQNAFHEIDTFCSLKKTYLMMTTILQFRDNANSLLESGVRVSAILDTKSKDNIANVKFEKDYEKLLGQIQKDMKAELDGLRK